MKEFKEKKCRVEKKNPTAYTRIHTYTHEYSNGCPHRPKEKGSFGVLRKKAMHSALAGVQGQPGTD